LFRMLSHGDGKFHFALDQRPIEGTRFSAVLGPNGTGKSQLLRSIAETQRVTARSRSAEVTRGGPTDPRAPRCVLVLSNMVMDLFTNSTKDRDTYRYLGLRQASNNASTGSLRDSTAGALLTCLGDATREGFLTPILSTLHADEILVSFDTKVSRPRETRDPLAIVTEALEGDDDKTHFAPADALLADLLQFRDSLDGQSTPESVASRSMRYFWSVGDRFQLQVIELIRLLKRLGFAEVRVHVRFGDRVVDLDALSSGQLLLLSTFARVAANVTQDALVLVDEPETGLHPNWQSAWVPLMRETIPSIFGAHVFVATHSPYLVSDADDVLVPGSEWGTFIEFNEPFRGRSVETLLYRVFGARVVGNQMVENDLTTVVEFISRPRDSNVADERARIALDRLRGLQGDDTADLNRIIDQAEKYLS
jgi:predicted ATPase